MCFAGPFNCSFICLFLLSSTELELFGCLLLDLLFLLSRRLEYRVKELDLVFVKISELVLESDGLFKGVLLGS